MSKLEIVANDESIHVVLYVDDNSTKNLIFPVKLPSKLTEKQKNRIYTRLLSYMTEIQNKKFNLYSGYDKNYTVGFFVDQESNYHLYFDNLDIDLLQFDKIAIIIHDVMKFNSITSKKIEEQLQKAFIQDENKEKDKSKNNYVPTEDFKNPLYARESVPYEFKVGDIPIEDFRSEFEIPKRQSAPYGFTQGDIPKEEFKQYEQKKSKDSFSPEYFQRKEIEIQAEYDATLTNAYNKIIEIESKINSFKAKYTSISVDINLEKELLKELYLQRELIISQYQKTMRVAKEKYELKLKKNQSEKRAYYDHEFKKEDGAQKDTDYFEEKKIHILYEYEIKIKDINNMEQDAANNVLMARQSLQHDPQNVNLIDYLKLIEEEYIRISNKAKKMRLYLEEKIKNELLQLEEEVYFKPKQSKFKRSNYSSYKSAGSKQRSFGWQKESARRSKASTFVKSENFNEDAGNQIIYYTNDHGEKIEFKYYENDYAKTLEIEGDVTEKKARKAYHALCLKYHPDKSGGSSEEIFTAVHVAYNKLISNLKQSRKKNNK